MRLSTISETHSFKEPLPPLPSSESDRLPPVATSRGTGVEDESGDQDPSISDGGEDYARAYSALQARKAAAAAGKPSTPKAQEASESPDSFSSERSDAMVFNMSAAAEPLYGDSGEDEFWKAREEH